MNWFDFYGHTKYTLPNMPSIRVRVNNKTMHALRTDLLVQSSKLLLYTLAQLIWCSYFI